MMTMLRPAGAADKDDDRGRAVTLRAGGASVSDVSESPQ